MAEYLLAGVAVFALNLMPAFGPPTWSLLVLLTVSFELEPVLLVPIGAVSAAAGRFVLASAAFRWRGHLGPERVRNLRTAGAAVEANRRRALAGLGLFAISPLPSAQLFIAAGLVGARLVPLTAAFFAGRLVSYSIYVGAASAAGASLSRLIGESLGSPLGIAIQLVMLAGLVALVRIDWTRILTARGAGGAHACVVGTERRSEAAPDAARPLSP